MSDFPDSLIDMRCILARWCDINSGYFMKIFSNPAADGIPFHGMGDTTTPVVTGPITGGTRGWPFGKPLVDLAAYGYQEDEFFLEGTAVRYGPAAGTELGRDGKWQVEPVESAPYKTRIIVIRPTDPAQFNGTVLVSWNNVSAG